MPAVSSAGIRRMALWNTSSRCSQSSANVPNAKSSGMAAPPLPHGLAFASKKPARMQPTSSLKYVALSGSRSVGSPDASPGTASVTT